MDSCEVFVIIPLILEETKLMLCHVKLGDWSWVLVPFLGACRMDVRHVESHLLEKVVVGVSDLGTVGDDAMKGCMDWGLLLYEEGPW